MKESIEEKAKAYDEALKVIKGCNPDENGFITICPQEIFPELKVSDDERMRNGLIKLLNCIAASEYENTIGITKEEALEWVKKKGEQKLADKVEQKQEWSVKDLTRFNDVIRIIESSDNVASIKKHYVDFLTSIMQRSIPQSKDKIITKICEWIDVNYVRYLDVSAKGTLTANIRQFINDLKQAMKDE